MKSMISSYTRVIVMQASISHETPGTDTIQIPAARALRRVFVVVIDGRRDRRGLGLAVAVQAHLFQKLGGHFRRVPALGITAAAEERTAAAFADDHRLAALVAVDVGRDVLKLDRRGHVAELTG